MLLNIDVLCTVRLDTVRLAERLLLQAPLQRDQLKPKPHRFGKRKRRFDSPHRQFGVVLSGSVYFQ
jgi:hypothetical protein